MRTKLAVFLSSGSVVDEVSAEISSFELSTIVPGGFGTCSFTIPRKHNRQLKPNQKLFSKVTVMSGADCVFVGRLDESAFGLQQGQEVMEFHAMGVGAYLQDDPLTTTYTTQTALQIISNQVSTRSAYFALSQDTSLILPSNPSATFTRGYNGKTFEEVLNDVVASLGDYVWAVWDHGTAVDSNGFPLGQITMDVTDRDTLHYQAIREDIREYTIRPSIEYCFNSATVLYRDTSSGSPTSQTATDSRLNLNKTQGTAPFPYRLLVKDYGSTTFTTAEASSIATALREQYKNGGYKISVTLDQIRDVSNTLIPLWMVRAGKNIFLPSLPVPSDILPSAVAANTNQFYIVETSYREGEHQTPSLEISCNTFVDQAAFQVARLQYNAAATAKDTSSKGEIQTSGQPEIGACGLGWGAGGLSTDTFEQTVNFKSVMKNVPTIALTVASSSNAASPTTTNITVNGFTFQVKPSVNGAGYWRGTYKTSGN